MSMATFILSAFVDYSLPLAVPFRIGHPCDKIHGWPRNEWPKPTLQYDSLVVERLCTFYLGFCIDIPSIYYALVLVSEALQFFLVGKLQTVIMSLILLL